MDRPAEFLPHHITLNTDTSSCITTIDIRNLHPSNTPLLEESKTATMSGPQIKTDSKYDDYDYPTTAPEVKSGHPGHTTPEQDAQVFQLRTQLEQEGYTERLDTLSMVD